VCVCVFLLDKLHEVHEEIIFEINKIKKKCY